MALRESGVAPGSRLPWIIEGFAHRFGSLDEFRVPVAEADIPSAGSVGIRRAFVPPVVPIGQHVFPAGWVHSVLRSPASVIHGIIAHVDQQNDPGRIADLRIPKVWNQPDVA